MNREKAMQILHEFAWPEKLANPLAVFEIQLEKFWQKKPFFVETASAEELQEAIKAMLKIARNHLKRFSKNYYKSKTVISYVTFDDIRYAFRYWCMLKNLSEIRFENFKEFAKKYEINGAVIDYNREPEEIETIDYLKASKTDIICLYTTICDLETDIAGDQMPRQWDNYIKYFNPDDEQVISRNRRTLDELSYYEDDVIKFVCPEVKKRAGKKPDYLRALKKL